MSALLTSQVMATVQAAVVSVAPFGADPAPTPTEVRPGWIALALTVALTGATILLWMNMRKQIGKIRFDEGDAAPPAEGSDGSSADGSPAEGAPSDETAPDETGVRGTAADDTADPAGTDRDESSVTGRNGSPPAQ